MSQMPTKGRMVFVKYTGDARPEGWEEENPGTVMRVDEAAGTMLVAVDIPWRKPPHPAVGRGAVCVPLGEDVLGEEGYSWRWPPRG